MANETQKAIHDDQRERLSKEVFQLISTYLEECNKNVKTRENIAESVFFFFNYLDYKTALFKFSNMAATVLSTIVRDEEIRNRLSWNMDEDDLNTLCEIFENLVGFCNDIIRTEANIARLDLAIWTTSRSKFLPIRELEEKKIWYELRLKQLRHNYKQ